MVQRTAAKLAGWERWAVAVLVVLIPLVAWGAYGIVFGGEGDGVGADGVQEIEVIITDFTYIPGMIRLQEGRPVRLIVTNEGKIPHDYVIEGVGPRVATAVLQPGETEILEFVPEVTGRLEVFCTIPGHQEMGLMTGGVVQ